MSPGRRARLRNWHGFVTGLKLASGPDFLPPSSRLCFNQEHPMERANTPTITPHEKAVQINLDRRFYGTFAEIGAGQEVARWFFVGGGESGPLAKTISAYDMDFSQAI